MAWGKSKKPDEPLVYNSLDELLALLAEERQKTLKSRRNAKIGLSIYLGIIVIVLIAGAMTHFHGMGGMGGMFGGITGMVASMYAATNTQKKGVQALAEYDDIRAVPRLIEMLEYKDDALKIDAATLLGNLLPKMRASDAPMLSLEHHAIINRLLAGKIGLKPQLAEPLQIATLGALQQIGDAISLPIVTELAKNTSLDAIHPVTVAARECLPFLQHRAENQRQTQTLLRASDGLHTPTDMLLRPAMNSTPNTPSDELLRAAPEAETRQEPLVVYSSVVTEMAKDDAAQEATVRVQ